MVVEPAVLFSILVFVLVSQLLLMLLLRLSEMTIGNVQTFRTNMRSSTSKTVTFLLSSFLPVADHSERRLWQGNDDAGE